MATINGVTFNMQNLSIVSEHRNIPTDQPGADENFITDMGYSGLVLRIEGFETSLATYDSVIAEFMKSGKQTLVPNSGYQFSVYSTQKTNDLIEGTTTNYYPYDLIMLTSTPYRDSTTLSCRANEITANNQTWTAEDAPCNNLIKNWNVETWSAGASSAPDFWELLGTGATIARNDTDEKFGTYCAELTYGSDTSYLRNNVPQYQDYIDHTLTFGCWVKTTTQAKVQIYDGIESSLSDLHSGGGDYEFMTVSHTLNSAATTLKVYILLYAAGTAYIDGAYLVEASSIADSTFTREITTSGNVDAIPDIQVTSESTPQEVISQTEKL